MSLDGADIYVLQRGATAEGTGYSVPILGMATLGVQLVGTFVATVTFEGTIDGDEWAAVLATSTATGVRAITATALTYSRNCMTPRRNAPTIA